VPDFVVKVFASKEFVVLAGLGVGANLCISKALVYLEVRFA
jgi:hypothetical protein